MSPSRSRRRVLRALAASSLFGLAGCATDSSPSDSTANSSPNQPTRTSSGLDTATPTPKPSITTSPAQSTTSQSNTTTPDSTTSRTSTPEPDTSTYGPTSGPDERETRTPPGSPSLESRSKWPAFRFDAANTGYNPDGTGLREAEQYWRLAPTSSASLNAETLFSVSSGDEDSKSFTRRDPATNDIRSRTQLVQYGVNAPPTVVGDRVFVTTFVEVFCLAANRDAVVWRGPEMDGIQAPPSLTGPCTSIAADSRQPHRSCGPSTPRPVTSSGATIREAGRTRRRPSQTIGCSSPVTMVSMPSTLPAASDRTSSRTLEGNGRRPWFRPTGSTLSLGGSERTINWSLST